MIVSVSKLPILSGYAPNLVRTPSVPDMLQEARDTLRVNRKVDPNVCLVVGCARCANYCGSGGPEQVKKFMEFLGTNPPEYSSGGTIIVANKQPVCGDPACNDKGMFDNISGYFSGDNPQNIGIVYVMACAAAVSWLQNSLPRLIKTKEKWPEIIPTTDTLGIGCITGTSICIACTACGVCNAKDGDCRMKNAFEGRLRRMSKAHPYLGRLRFMTWREYISRTQANKL